MSGFWSNRLSPSWNPLSLHSMDLKWRPTFNFCFKVAVWACSTLCFLLPLSNYFYCLFHLCPTPCMSPSLYVPLPVCSTPCMSHSLYVSLYVLPLVCPTLHLTLCVPCSVCPTLISHSVYFPLRVCPTPYWKGKSGLWGGEVAQLFLRSGWKYRSNRKTDVAKHAILSHFIIAQGPKRGFHRQKLKENVDSKLQAPQYVSTLVFCCVHVRLRMCSTPCVHPGRIPLHVCPTPYVFHTGFSLHVFALWVFCSLSVLLHVWAGDIYTRRRADCRKQEPCAHAFQKAKRTGER